MIDTGQSIVSRNSFECLELFCEFCNCMDCTCTNTACEYDDIDQFGYDKQLGSTDHNEIQTKHKENRSKFKCRNINKTNVNGSKKSKKGNNDDDLHLNDDFRSILSNKQNSNHKNV